MQHLWNMTGETVNLAVRDGLYVLYIDVMESSHQFRLVSQVGTRRPLHCTALGKAMLAFTAPDERDATLASLRFERFSPRTITTQTRFRKELERITQHGYAVDDEEAGLGSRCVSSPIFDQSGKVAAAISVSGPITRINQPRLLAFAYAVREGARVISQRLGHQDAKAAGAVLGR